MLLNCAKKEDLIYHDIWIYSEWQKFEKKKAANIRPWWVL